MSGLLTPEMIARLVAYESVGALSALLEPGGKLVVGARCGIIVDIGLDGSELAFPINRFVASVLAPAFAALGCADPISMSLHPEWYEEATLTRCRDGRRQTREGA